MAKLKKERETGMNMQKLQRIEKNMQELEKRFEVIRKEIENINTNLAENTKQAR